MSNKKKQLSHPIVYHIAKFLVRPFVYFKLGYRRKSKYKIAKNESVIILSNHQTDYDPIIIHYSFNKFIRCLSTDNIFAGKLAGKFLKYLGTIPKRKGTTDVASVMEMMRAISNGDSLLIFPEGNRSYAEFQFPIEESIVQLIKKLKVTIILFNLHGGFGRMPRIGSKPRKGKFYGEIKQILKYDEYKDYDDHELYKLIIDNLKVFDSESGELYKSNKRAECFERLFFICPKCGSVQSIYSKGNYIRCHNCDLKVEYGEDLHLHSKDPAFKFTKLVEWYEYQKQFILNHDFTKHEPIFRDENVRLHLAIPYKKKEVLVKNGVLALTEKYLKIGKMQFDLKDISIASPVSGRKLCITINGGNYVFRGDKNFNAIKYVFLLNQLDSKMKKDNLDIYYRVDK